MLGSTRLKEIAFADISVMAVFSRFGLRPGYGNLTVDEACVRHSIDRKLFIMVINDFLDTDVAGSGYQCEMPDRETSVAFLSDTDDFYERVQLPNILRHMRPLSAMPGPLNNYLEQLAEKFRMRGAYDRRVLFPALLSCGEQAVAESDIATALNLDQEIEEELRDLLEFFVVHLDSPHDPNMLLGVITAVEALRKDVSGTNRIRKMLLSRLGDVKLESEESKETDKGPLTQREKEVLKLLSCGLSNKEVADRLCISANTAITHRRNITSKLGIHSLAGLSLYAYTHGLTDNHGLDGPK